MSKMSIIDAAEFFGVSKEAIHNRIRRGSLNSIIENGIKYVIIDETQPQKVKVRNQTATLNEKYYQLLEEQNQYLQKKLEKQEDEIKILREQKEELLIQERLKIEQIYKDRDEQLKYILSSFKEQIFLGNNDEAHIDAEIELIDTQTDKEKENLITLKKFLKVNKIKPKKVKKIKNKVRKLIQKNSKKIILKDKKIYLNPIKFNYKKIFGI